MYRQPAIRKPSTAEIVQIAEKLNLCLTDEEIAACHDSFPGAIESYQCIADLPEPALPVKYPRTPGHRPVPEDNPYNAWYWKSEIQGASEGKLLGKTIGIKDAIAVAGVPMSNGSKLLEGHVPEYDATVVTRILDAGGRIVGKTACENLCASTSSFTCFTGPVGNPHNEAHTTGGSSSGNAALLAGGQIDLAVGTDEGGSVRVPACFCGIVGLKPTFGLVPHTGAMSGLTSISHVGPMARNVHDCALLLEVLAGYDDGLDPRQTTDVAVPNYTQHLNDSISGIKIGLLIEGFEECKNNVDSIVKDAAKLLSPHCAIVEEVSLPMHNDGRHIFSVVAEGTYEVMVRGCGSGFGWKGHYCTSTQEFMARAYKTHAHDLPVVIKLMCITGEYMKDKYNNYYYAKACNQVRLLTKAYNEALKNYDVLILPTVKFTAPKLPPADLSPKEYLDQVFAMTGRNTCCFNVTGHPALSINAGFSCGLPVGMMIVGKHFDETTVLKVAHHFEKNRNV